MAKCNWCSEEATRVARAPWGVYEKHSCEEHLGALKRVVRIDLPESTAAAVTYEELSPGSSDPERSQA